MIIRCWSILFLMSFSSVYFLCLRKSWDIFSDPGEVDVFLLHKSWDIFSIRCSGAVIFIAFMSLGIFFVITGRAVDEVYDKGAGYRQKRWVDFFYIKRKGSGSDGFAEKNIPRLIEREQARSSVSRIEVMKI